MSNEKKEKTVEIVEKLPDGVVILDEEENIHFVNPAACRLLGRSEEELLGVDFGSPIVGSETTEVDIPRKDGGIATAELRIEPIEWDGQNMRLLSLRDISARKRADEALFYSDSIHTMMAEVSSELVTANTENVDEKINRLLERVGKFFRADRCFITSLSSDHSTITGTYEWDAEGVEPRIEHQMEISVEDVPWSARQVLDGKTVKIDKKGESIPDISPKERKILLYDSESLFVVPIISDAGQVSGAVNFEASNENKAWTDVDQNAMRILANNIAGVRNKITAEMQCENYRKAIDGQYECENIVSRNGVMQELFSILPDIAASEASVIIEGETGTGKELIAVAIHNLSGRSEGPFVSVNCGALPEKLVESELFGYKAGAFTDARKDKPGRFSRAEGGTIFLDEVGELSPGAQVKLLHVLQDGAYEPVGGVVTEKADVRIVAATNKNLMAEVENGRFREDLYYRLKVMRLELPPLRERKEDIPILIKHQIERLNLVQDRDIAGVTNEAMALLLNHNYPGNVRELENILRHGFVLCNGKEIESHHLPLELQRAGPGNGGPATDLDGQAGQETIEQMERYMIERAMMRHDGNKTASARELGIGKRTLYRKLKKYGLAE